MGTAAAFTGLAAMPRRAKAAGRCVLSIYAPNTRESLTGEYVVDGWYNPDVLAEFDRVLRDRRNNEVTPMDPHLLDILYALQTQCGRGEPLHVLCGYRSPATNAMLRAQGRGAAGNSYHMYGRAADIRIPDYNLRSLRAAAIDLGAGGVGYYGRSNFVHVDTGDIRTW